jgi:WD40 repeat protein
MRTSFSGGAGAPSRLERARSRWNRRALLAIVMAAGMTAALVAASPVFWNVATQSEFLKGDVEDLSIDSDGRVFLGPSTALLAETAAPFLWTVLSLPDGTLYAGSGNEGKVMRVGRDGKMSTFFDAAELEVHAIAVAPRGGLSVATSPDGKIYEVASDGTSKVFFDPDDKYIWALAVDGAGNVFAATGDKGVIYKITPAGAGSQFYKTNTTNVVSLAIAPSGDLIAGTESPGRVFKLDASGRAFVLLDSPFREIHAVRVASDGTIYAVAMNGAGGDRPADRPTAPEPDRPPVASVSTEITTVGVVDSPPPPSGGPSTTRPRRVGRGTIYRIRTDGFSDPLWESGDDAPYDLLIEPGGSLLVATGTDGKIFRISGDPARATLVTRAAARQVTALLREPSGRIVGATSNPGKLVALGADTAKRGTYESDVRDAGTTASWGVIRWRASGKPGQVQVSTRSGNTASPDETWSSWSSAYSNPEGEQMKSPNARYLQFRAVFSGDAASSPSLTSVTAAYLPRNLRPEVVSITVHPAGTVFQRPFSTGELEIAGYEDNTSDNRPPSQSLSSTSGSVPLSGAPALGRRIYQKGLQTLVWKAEDGNDDRLQYDVLYRREGETAWKVLKRGLWDPIVVWDTTSVPDGTYVVKVAASDAPANSPDLALVGEMESLPFDIDNSPPVIELQPVVRSGNRTSLPFVVRDSQSAVQRVEYSLDASRWRVVYPKDGIPDSRREEFDLVIDEREPGRSVIVRATDAMNNVASAVAQIR